MLLAFPVMDPRAEGGRGQHSSNRERRPNDRED